MTIETGWLISGGLGFLLALAVCLLYMCRKIRETYEKGKADMLPQLETRDAERHALEKRLAVLEHETEMIPDLQNQVSERDERIVRLQDKVAELSAELAREKERGEQINELRQRLKKQEETIDTLRKRCSDHEAHISRLNTTLEKDRNQAEEKMALLREAREELTHQFKLLAQEILEEKGKAFGEMSQSGLKALLDPFGIS